LLLFIYICLSSFIHLFVQELTTFVTRNPPPMAVGLTVSKIDQSQCLMHRVTVTLSEFCNSISHW